MANPLALIMQFVSQVTDFVKYVKVHVLTYITFGTKIATESHIPSSLRGNPIRFSILYRLRQFVPGQLRNLACEKQVQKPVKMGVTFSGPGQKHRL